MLTGRSLEKGKVFRERIVLLHLCLDFCSSVFSWPILRISKPSDKPLFSPFRATGLNVGFAIVFLAWASFCLLIVMIKPLKTGLSFNTLFIR